MAKRINEKYLTIAIDSKVRDQFQTLCKTLDVSATSIMRSWIETALEQGTTNFQSADLIIANPPNSKGVKDDKVIQNILSRLDDIERQTAYINESQMEFIKDEVLGDKFGTLRNRMGVVESQLQDLGGNIARSSENEEA